MKKILGIFVVIIAAVLLLGPLYAGMKAEKQLQSFIATLDGYPGYHVEWSTYERHWFSTDATLALGFAMPAAADQQQAPPLTLPLSVQIKHGPLLLDTASLGWYSWQLDLTEEQNAQIAEHLQKDSDAPLYQGRGYMGLMGTVGHRDELQAFSYTDEEQGTVAHINGYTGNLTIDSARQLNYSGMVKGMDFTAQDALLVMGNLTMAVNGDLSRMDWDTLVYPSDVFMKVASMQLQGGDQTFEMTHGILEGAVELAENNEWMTLILTMSVGNVTTPQTTVEDAEMTFAYERISLSAYKAYVDMMGAMSETGQPNMQQFFTPEVVQDFFAKNPKFALRNFSFNMPEGDFKASFELGMREGFVMPDPLVNPMALLQALAVNASAQVDRPLATYFAKQSARKRAQESMTAESEISEAELDATLEQQAQATLDMLTAQGMLVEDGEGLKAVLQFLDGQLLLNGKPMPLPLGMLMGGLQPTAQP